MPGEKYMPALPERWLKHEWSTPAMPGTCYRNRAARRRYACRIHSKMTKPSWNGSYRRVLHRGFLPLFCRRWPSRALFAPECLGHSGRALLHIIERKHIILRNISAQHAAFREPDGQGGHGASCSRVINEPIRAEPTDTVKEFAGFEITLGDGHHFGDRASGRGNRGILMDDRPSDGRGNLDVRKMERSIKDIERTVAQLVVCQLNLLERRVLVNNDEGAEIGRAHV